MIFFLKISARTAGKLATNEILFSCTILRLIYKGSAKFDQISVLGV